MERLWKITGTTKGGNAVRIKMRAAEYFEAREKARKTGMVICEIVLMTGGEEIVRRWTPETARRRVGGTFGT